MTVDDEFEDDGEIGREITYSTDRLGDIVQVEVWSLNDPVTVIDEFYTENLFYRTYDNFEQFRNDLEYKLHRYLR